MDDNKSGENRAEPPPGEADGFAGRGVVTLEPSMDNSTDGNSGDRRHQKPHQLAGDRADVENRRRVGDFLGDCRIVDDLAKRGPGQIISGHPSLEEAERYNQAGDNCDNNPSPLPERGESAVQQINHAHGLVCDRMYSHTRHPSHSRLQTGGCSLWPQSSLPFPAWSGNDDHVISSNACGNPEGNSNPDAYGEAFAEVYDEWYHDVTDAVATARFVADRCGSGPVLEIGVGTGRLAQPLVERSLTVIGVDASAGMLDHCRRRRLGCRLLLTRADMTRLPLRQCAGAALIAFNTLFNVATADGQRAVFQQLHQALEADGVLIVEALDAEAFDHDPEPSMGLRTRRPDGVTVVASKVNPVEQTIIGQHLDVSDRGVEVRPWRLRWATIDQLDEYAADAGFRLIERFADWDCTPHDATSSIHISVYQPRSGYQPPSVHQPPSVYQARTAIGSDE